MLALHYLQISLVLARFHQALLAPYDGTLLFKPAVAGHAYTACSDAEVIIAIWPAVDVSSVHVQLGVTGPTSWSTALSTMQQRHFVHSALNTTSQTGTGWVGVVHTCALQV